MDRSADQISTSLRHRLLADEYRRVLLGALPVRTLPVGLSELAAAVDLRYTGGGQADLAQIEVMLHHVHLPLLAEAGVVQYDSESTEVTAFRPIDGS